jgi:hypothetical protein
MNIHTLIPIPLKDKKILLLLGIPLLVVLLATTHLALINRSIQKVVNQTSGECNDKVVRAVNEYATKHPEQKCNFFDIWPRTQVPVQVGKFTFRTPKGYLINAGEEDTLKEVVTVTPSNYQNSGLYSECIKISNVYNKYLRYKQDIADAYDSGLSIESWHEDEVELKPEYKDKIELDEIINYLRELDTHLFTQYPNTTIRSPELGLSQYTACGGGYFYPILIQKVPSTELDKAYYIEALAGNGQIEQAPKRMLIGNKGRNWIIIDDYDSSNAIVKGKQIYEEIIKVCKTDPEQQSSISCVAKVWASRYRNTALNNAWIYSMLSSIQSN